MFSFKNISFSLYSEDRNEHNNMNLHSLYFKPEIFRKPGVFDSLVRGIATQPSGKIDMHYDENVSYYLRLFFIVNLYSKHFASAYSDQFDVTSFKCDESVDPISLHINLSDVFNGIQQMKFSFSFGPHGVSSVYLGSCI